ncbi:L-ascorbate metabolism protein UlaG, beta-lactamase superfamily [Modicisalibacter ilicicola DSM 19980]|uniref:L-ascorbate metabolism protein UlaG, beta-lactamase superfamily n=2 Tax=Modicisalibacter ilicicola TaxID=480814 RepID=A0A1M4ZRR4_9GAMM|nr:L-ascorbate metabolism protein UlaG, beta-lactamase superfamily [Halomonas ilicicola DSM 19980]
MKIIPVALSAALLSLTSVPLQAQAADSEDAMSTAQGPVSLSPIEHGSLVLQWNDQTIYIDPTGTADAYQGLDAADLILITHPHGDHLSTETLDAIDTSAATVIMPQSVADEIGDSYGEAQRVMANGDTIELDGLRIHAMPMYNLPEDEDPRHPRGFGNGYVLTLGDKRVYISGDTEGIEEMRSLEDIDMAFVCMNLPYTMDVEQAADAVLDFAPAVVYPYHYRGQDVQRFKTLVNEQNPDIEVRLREWYPE